MPPSLRKLNFSQGGALWTSDPASAAPHSGQTRNSSAERETLFTFNHKKSRPLAKSARNPTTSEMAYVEQGEALEELGRRIHEVQEPSAKSIYHHLVGVGQVSSFLKAEESGYDFEHGTWASIPQEPAHEDELRGPFKKVVDTIVNHFHPSPYRRPSFEVPEDARQSQGVGYTNITTAIDVKLDQSKGKREAHCKRLALYNRQIFLQQPNRHFARSLIVTEKMFRLVHYDRSGIYVTPLFDIHKDASLFVQFVVGLTSPNEQDLGLDTSVRWTIDETSGKKVSGTIALEEHNDETQESTTKTYDLDMKEAPFVRPGIRSRGTVAWHARDPVTGHAVVVKDAWRTDSRESELKHLLKARGIQGVVEMLAYQDSCSQTIHFRPPCFNSDQFHNRLKLRLVLKKYGKSIWFFRSRLELLCALRDVLIGHRELVDRGVLHRDISMLNILLGVPGAALGDRGILIDLDMATSADHRKSSLPADPYTGTRTYQSITVLEGRVPGFAPPQDYMDDVESLFYVYCRLIYSFRQPGVLMPLNEASNRPENWDEDDLVVALSAKTSFSLTPMKTTFISSYWKGACVTLLREFHSTIGDVVREKDEIGANEDLGEEGRAKAYDAVVESLEARSKRVEAAFGHAVSTLEKEGPNAQEIEPYPKSFCAPHMASSVPPELFLSTPRSACTPPRTTKPPDGSIPLGRPTNAGPSTCKKRPLENSDDESTPRKRLRDGVIKN